MRKAPEHPRETERLHSLNALDLLDTLPEDEYDEITLLASRICQTPIALISLVDKDRQWFKSKQGLSASETGRDVSFCGHAILDKNIFYVPDAKKDERFFDNPLVTGGPQVGFYVGVPILDPIDRNPIGTLCAIDTKPRELSVEQLESLEALKNQVERMLVLRVQLNSIKKSEAQILELSHRQELILEGAGLGAWDWWLDSNKVNYDLRWFKMLGIDELNSDQNKMAWDSRIHPDDQQKTKQDIQDHLDGKTKVFENIHRLKHANGDWIWILARGRISEKDLHGKALRFTGTNLNISDYKKKELISVEIQKVAKIAGWEFNVDKNITQWTDETFNIYQINSNKPVAEINLFDYFSAKEKIRKTECFQNCLEGKNFREIFEFPCATGEKKWVEVSGFPFPNSENKIKSIIGTFLDVTDKVTNEKEIELNRVKAVHANKLAALGEISAGVAHEINNPLTIITGQISLLKRFKPKEIQEDQFEIKIESISKAVSRISKIVNGLRKFSRSNDFTEMATVPLSEIINEALVIAELKAKRCSIPILIEFKSDEKIVCDSIEIEQVVINLINNAVDAAASNQNGWVKIKLFTQNKEIVLQILDSGTGVPEEIEEKIFQPFFTTKSVGEGTGLGLSICKGILHRHQATLSLNKSFQNTCFEVRFKLTQKTQIAA